MGKKFDNYVKQLLAEETGAKTARTSSGSMSGSKYWDYANKILEKENTAPAPVRPAASVADNRARMQSVIGEVGTALKTAGNAISPKIGNEYKAYQSRIRAAENAVREAQAAEALNPNIHGNIGYDFKGADTAGAMRNLNALKDEYTRFKTDKYFEKQNEKLSDIYNKAENDPDFIKMVRLGSDRYHLVENAKKSNEYTSHRQAENDVSGIGDYKAQIQLGNLTPQERNTYFYLLGKEGWNAADEYEKLMERTVNERVAQNTYDYIKGVSRENKAAGVGLNTVASLMGGAGLLKTAAQAAGNAFRPDEEYIPGDRYDPAYAANLMQKAATEGVTGDIESPLGKFFAETGLSTANFLTNLAAGGGGFTTLALMGSNAGGQSAYDALERGATAEQAAKAGLMSAAAEMAFERIPVGTASELFSGRFKDSFGKAMLQMAMEEGFEEVATEYTNLLGDNIVMGDKSEYNQFVKDLEAQGISPEEARKSAILEFAVKRPAMAFAGGAVSGAGIGAAGGAYGGTNNTGNRTNIAPGDFFDSVAQAVAEENGISVEEAEIKVFEALSEAAGAGVGNGTGNESLTVGSEVKPEPVRVGRARVLENPYDGPTPIVDNNVQRNRVSIPVESFDKAKEIIAANPQNVGEIRRTYLGIMRGMKGPAASIRARVKGLMFGGAEYDVDIPNKIVGKLLKGEPLPEALSVIESLPEVVQEGEYVGSSKYDQHRTKNENTIRYDYFETPIEIGGENYIVAFDVAVQPDKNRYKTHRVINEISLTENRIGLANQEITADSAPSGFDNSIPSNRENINTFSAENAGNVIENSDNADTSDFYGANINKDRADFAEVIKTGQDMMRARRAYQNALESYGLNEEEQDVLNSVLKQTKGARKTAGGSFDAFAFARNMLYNMPAADTVNKFRIENEILPDALEYDALREAYGRKSGLLKNGVKGLAEEMVKQMYLAKDKKAISYWRETPERIFEDIFKADPSVAKAFIETYISDIHTNESDRNRFLNKIRNGLKDLDIDSGKKRLFDVAFRNQTGTLIQTSLNEDGIVQAYGEGLLTDADLANLKDGKGNAIDAEKIKRAADWISAEYKKIIDSVNLVLLEYGYDPIPERQNYFPHWSEEELTGIKGVFNKFGFDLEAKDLPTSIAGITENFRPGKQWSGNFLQRQGASTDYGALRGMDKYIESVSNILYHTGDIQKLRALEDAIRYRYAPDTIAQEIKDIRFKQEVGEIDFDTAQERINELWKDNKISHLPNFVSWLQEYTNLLAGKTSFLDRDIERFFGRKSLALFKSVNNRFASNVVGGNVSSAFTNFIPFTQADISAQNKLRGAMETIQNFADNDGLMERSTFYTNRIGSEPLFKGKLQTFSDKSGFLMEGVDRFTVESLIRGRYYDNIAKGMDEVSAMADADDHAARVVADRSKGALPVAFQAKSPLIKLLTMFQTEVNNQYSYMFKDIPRANRDKAMGAVIAALMKVFIGAFAYNEIFEKVIGRRPAFDPIDIMTAAIDRFSGRERNNLFDVFGGEDLFRETDMSSYDALAATGKDVAEEIPFVGGLLGGGRIPVSGAIPDVPAILKNSLKKSENPEMAEKANENIMKEVLKPVYYFIPPAGGGQAKKTIEGLWEMHKGGSYIHNNKGEEILRYPVEDPAAGDYVKNALFGRTASEGYRTWKKYGFKNLTAEETANYHKIVEAGMSYEQFMKYKYVFSTTDATKEEKAQLIKNDKDLSIKQKNALSEVLLNTDSFNPDYSKTGEAFDVSLMSDVQQRAYKAIYTEENDIRGIDEFKEIYNVLQGSGDKYKDMNLKKEDKINILMRDFGYNEAGAMALWDDFQHRETGGD